MFTIYTRFIHDIRWCSIPTSTSPECSTMLPSSSSVKLRTQLSRILVDLINIPKTYWKPSNYIMVLVIPTTTLRYDKYRQNIFETYHSGSCLPSNCSIIPTSVSLLTISDIFCVYTKTTMHGTQNKKEKFWCLSLLHLPYPFYILLELCPVCLHCLAPAGSTKALPHVTHLKSLIPLCLFKCCTSPVLWVKAFGHIVQWWSFVPVWIFS